MYYDRSTTNPLCGLGNDYGSAGSEEMPSWTPEPVTPSVYPQTDPGVRIPQVHTTQSVMPRYPKPAPSPQPWYADLPTPDPGVRIPTTFPQAPIPQAPARLSPPPFSAPTHIPQTAVVQQRRAASKQVAAKAKQALDANLARQRQLYEELGNVTKLAQRSALHESAKEQVAQMTAAGQSIPADLRRRAEMVPTGMLSARSEQELVAQLDQLQAEEQQHRGVLREGGFEIIQDVLERIGDTVSEFLDRFKPEPELSVEEYYAPKPGTARHAEIQSQIGQRRPTAAKQLIDVLSW